MDDEFFQSEEKALSLKSLFMGIVFRVAVESGCHIFPFYQIVYHFGSESSPFVPASRICFGIL